MFFFVLISYDVRVFRGFFFSSSLLFIMLSWNEQFDLCFFEALITPFLLILSFWPSSFWLMISWYLHDNYSEKTSLKRWCLELWKGPCSSCLKELKMSQGLCWSNKFIFVFCLYYSVCLMLSRYRFETSFSVFLCLESRVMLCEVTFLLTDVAIGAMCSWFIIMSSTHKWGLKFKLQLILSMGETIWSGTDPLKKFWAFPACVIDDIFLALSMHKDPTEST